MSKSIVDQSGINESAMDETVVDEAFIGQSNIKQPDRKKTAVVTGASSGIGLAISRVLCELGYEVYGFGRDFSWYNREKSCFRNDGTQGDENLYGMGYTENFYPVSGNLLDTRWVCNELKEICRKSQVEVLVNGAGVGCYGLHEHLSVKQIQTLVRTNLELPLILTNRLLRVLKENKGYIINISSITAKQNSPHGCAYAATKAGLTSFGASLFEEARKYGVKVTTIHPDMTDTNLYRDADFTCSDEEGSFLTASDIAEAVKFVLSQRNGVVVPDIMLRPQLHRIAKKTRG